MPIFERFIRYDWAEHALELAVQNEPPHLLRTWLENQGLHEESARRTANILTNLWFPKEPFLHDLHTQAMDLSPALSSGDRLVLHWGMALIVFPLFHHVAQVMGRLLRLQGSFQKREIISRVLERYSNQSTMRRATERVLQSVTEWGILEERDNRYQSKPTQTLLNPEASAWLYRVVLSIDPERHWQINDLTRAAEIFPFEIEHPLVILRHNQTFSFQRDAAGNELVGLSMSSTLRRV